MRKKLSLRAQVILTFIAFVVFVLGLVFVFQAFFLDDFYKANKIVALKRTGDTVAEKIESVSLTDELETITIEDDVCVRIVSNSLNVEGYTQHSYCPISKLNPRQISNITLNVENNGGSQLFDDVRINGPEVADTYIYGKLTSYKDDKALILASTTVTPLGATLSTIKNQYWSISAIVIVATILMALIISKTLIKPIKMINEEATLLPQGKYNSDNIKVNNQEMSDLNDTLGSANKEILKADKAKKELIANVSHDLRTPLTMIQGYGEMIKDYPKEDTIKNAEVIIEEAKRLSTLVNDLIDVSKYETNNLVLNKEDISLNELLESVYKQYEKYCKSIKIKFELKLLEEDITINIDIRRMKQVLYNFINNAINYNDKDEKEIILGVELIDNIHRVYVYDNGTGISKNNIAKVWDRYYKVDKEHKRAQIGSGIGLALCKSILEASELKYGVESKKGQYSKFYFDI